MLFWNRFPFIRITVLFAAGIITGDHLIISYKIPVLISSCCVLIYVFTANRLQKKTFRKYNHVLSFMAFITLFSLGSLHVQLKKPAVNTIEQIHKHHQFEHYLVQISNVTGSTEKYRKVIGKIKLARQKEQVFTMQAKVLLYVPKETSPQYGDQMIISGNPSLFNDPLFPFEFNYRAYMHRKGILFNHFLSPSKYVILKKNNRFNLPRIAFSVRSKIIEIIQKRLEDHQVEALLIALTTGKRDLFNDETYNQFLGAGIVHILAVSGLHIGILYMMLIFVTRPLSRTRSGRWIRLFIIIHTFLFFALMTGLSPSVLRSVVMFSIMLIGISLERNSHILNSVFLSAFLLLCYDPGLLFQAGFQLSYAAVIGIILFQPLIFSMFKTKFMVTNWLVNLLSVSISAQIATLPFTLYYFKQFPTYFFVSNLFAIPFASIFLPGGIILSITYFFTRLNQFIAIVLEILGKFFIHIIKIINQLPGSLIRPVNLSFTDAILSACALMILYFLLTYKKPGLIKFIFIILLFIILRNAFFYFMSSDDKRIIVYSIPGLFCFELIDEHQSLVIMDTDDKQKVDRFNYHTESFHIHNNINNQIVSLSKINQHLPGYRNMNGHILVWNEKLILITPSEKYPFWIEKINGSIDLAILLKDKINRPVVSDIKISKKFIKNNSKGMMYISIK